MDKNSFGKGAGIGAAIAAIIAIICQITHNGAMPWIVLIAFILKKLHSPKCRYVHYIEGIGASVCKCHEFEQMNKNFLKLPVNIFGY